MRLAVLGGSSVVVKDGQFYTAWHFGTVIHAFARRYREVILSVSECPHPNPAHDYLLPENVSLVGLPFEVSKWDRLRHSNTFASAFRTAITKADAVFVRGVLTPAVEVIYSECARQNKSVCHWLVGNPWALLNSHRRDGWLKDTAGKAYVLWWEHRLHRGHQKARAAYLCNGEEIARRHPSDHCFVTVSTTLCADDFFRREDTCLADPLKILCISYVRPEKGIEYLLEAFARLNTGRPAVLRIVGERGRYAAYQNRLDELVKRYQLGNRVEWVGHETREQARQSMREADLFVLPSLSEGTPRVLVEARAASVPVVSTNIGGIPTSVTDGVDGLLVPPKDPAVLASAMARIIENGDLRRRLISNGFTRVQNMTVDKFADKVVDILNSI